MKWKMYSKQKKRLQSGSMKLGPVFNIHLSYNEPFLLVM